VKTPARSRNGLAAAAGLGLIALVLLGPPAGRAQDAEPGPRIKLGLGLEYFSRTLAWDGDTRTSVMTAAFGCLRLEYEIQKGFSLAAFLGYGFSNFNGLVFRGLPFSLDYEAGAGGGFLGGLEAEKSLFSAGDFEIGIQAQYVLSLGGTKSLTIADLNQAGTAGGKATWMRVQAGPVVRYTGYQDLTPYLAITYNRLWGTYTMNETVQELTGAEEKAIAGAGGVGVAFGILYEPLPNVSLKGEIAALPYKKIAATGLGFDFGGSIKATLSF
jgi:hypothetical protein